MEMEQKIKIFENEEFGKVRTVIKDGEPWWILKVVLSISLDTFYSNKNYATRKI